MAIYFLDTSVFFRAYMPDEDGHDVALELLAGDQRLTGSELLRIEAASAVQAAGRAGRLSSQDVADVLSEMYDDTGPDGIVKLIDLDGPPTLARALALVLDHPLHTLDALHLAVADREGRSLAAPDDELVFATFDRRQRETARAIGFAVL